MRLFPTFGEFFRGIAVSVVLAQKPVRSGNRFVAPAVEPVAQRKELKAW
jgi:hypothetical protein